MNNDKNFKLETLSRKSIVVKGNPLVQAKFDELTVIENKLIITALSKITSYDKVLDEIHFTVKEFCNLLKINADGMYSHLKIACDKLLRRIVTIEIKKNHWKKFSWLHRIEYENGIIKLKFHPDLEPYLLYCKKNNQYTKYFLENIIDMEGKYSIRIFELLKQYETIGYRTFKLDELKELIGIRKGKYVQLSHFRTKVLLTSKHEINGLSDIDIDYELIKKGRKVEEIKYIITKKSYKIHTTTTYDLLPKLKLISEIRTQILNMTGFVIDFKVLDKYHRIVLIEMLKRIHVGGFNKVIIQHPQAFFIWHLNDITNNYDKTKLWEKEDY